MKKLFNKKPIIKQKDKICSLFSLFNKNNFIFSFFFKKWYQEKYCDNLNFLVTTLKKNLRAALNMVPSSYEQFLHFGSLNIVAHVELFIVIHTQLKSCFENMISIIYLVHRVFNIILALWKN